MSLENYIVRIYRRDARDPRLMVGIVEEIGSKTKRGFTSFDELRTILATAGDDASPKKGRPRKEPGGKG